MDIVKWLASELILAHPDFSKLFQLYTNASKIRLGTVLTQVDKAGLEHTVAYVSRQTHGKELDYDTTHLECLTVVWVMENFKPFLRDKRFDLIMDHAALVSLLKRHYV